MSGAWSAVSQKKDRSETQPAAAHGGLDYSCSAIEKPLLDWQSFKDTFNKDDWYQAAVNVAYGPELEKGWRKAADECTLGFVVANVVKAATDCHNS